MVRKLQDWATFISMIVILLGCIGPSVLFGWPLPRGLQIALVPAALGAVYFGAKLVIAAAR